MVPVPLLPCTHSRSLARSLSLSLSCARALSLTHSLTHQVSLSLSFSLARSLSRAHATDGTNALATLGSTLQISGTQPNLSASKRGEGGGGGGSLRNTASLRSQGSFPLNSSLVRGDCIVAPAPFGPGNEYTEEVPRRWAESRST
jgi:hypothetical protein